MAPTVAFIPPVKKHDLGSLKQQPPGMLILTHCVFGAAGSLIRTDWQVTVTHT